MKYHLKQVLKGKEENYIKTIYFHDRNIGKTVTLARLSAKYEIPVVVRTNSWRCLIELDIPKKLPKYFKHNKPKTIVLNNGTRGLRYSYLLMEEGFDGKEIEDIREMTLKGVVGYKNH